MSRGTSAARAVAAAVAAGLALLAACSAPGPEPRPSPSAESSRAPGLRLPLERRVSPSMRPVGRGSDTDQRAFSSVVDGRYVVDEYRSSDSTVVVADLVVDGTDGSLRSGTVVLRARIPGAAAGWVIGDVWLDAPWLVVVAERGDGGAGSRAYRFDLRGGRRTELTAIRGLPPPASGARWTYADGYAAYMSVDSERRRSCLVVVDVGAASWRTRTCVGGRFTDWPVLGADGQLVYRLQSTPQGGRQPCTRLFHGPVDGGSTLTEIPLRRHCIGFSGVADKKVVAWSEVGLHDESVEQSPAYARVGSRVVKLGTIETGSLSACHGWIYWQRPPTAAAEGETLMRWRPGEARQSVLRTRGTSLLAPQRCAAGWLSVTSDDLDTGQLTSYAVPPG